MDKKVYGVSIDRLHNNAVGTNADDIQAMSDKEKLEFVNVWGYEDQVYTLDAFFYYLNADMLDTENYYWIVI